MLNTGEEEFTLYLHDTRGPYQLCFKLSARAPNWKPSAIVKLGYFDVNIWSLKDSIPGKSADKDTAAVKTLEEVAEEAKNLPSRNELSTMHANLQWLYSQLQRVTHEQKHLLDWSDLQIANLRQSRSSSYIYSTASTVLFLATNIGCLLTVTTMMRGQSLTSAAGLPFWGKGRDLL